MKHYNSFYVRQDGIDKGSDTLLYIYIKEGPVTFLGYGKFINSSFQANWISSNSKEICYEINNK